MILFKRKIIDILLICKLGGLNILEYNNVYFSKGHRLRSYLLK